MMGDNVRYARLCHIVKWEDFDGYGFNLHAEKGKSGQYIGKVDEGSPSEAAGLKQGDRIVEVNEINIANETHKQVVDRIKAFPNETKLLVVDQEADDYFKENNIVIKGTMANVKVTRTPEKSPASETDSACARSVGSDSSVDENTHKSISSTNTTNSGSTVAAMVDNSAAEESRESVNGNGNAGGEQKGLNLKMSAKELRAQLAARKKYDPKKESLGFKDKFDIVQKL